MGAVSPRGHGPYSPRWPCQRRHPLARARAICAAIGRPPRASQTFPTRQRTTTPSPDQAPRPSRSEGRPPPKSAGLLDTCSTGDVWHECCSMPHRAVDVGLRAAAPYAKTRTLAVPFPEACAVWLQWLASSFSFLSLVFLRLTFLASGDRVSRTVRSVRRPRPPCLPRQELPLSLSGSEPLFILS
jgi:hypothetical protein